MFKTTTDFRIGELKPLKKQLFKITEENGQLNFHIEGNDDKNEYSLDFITIISLEEMLEFNLYEHINFIKCVDAGDIVFGKNGIYDLNTEINMEIVRYLSKSFVITIYFKDRDDIVGNLELTFSI